MKDQRQERRSNTISEECQKKLQYSLDNDLPRRKVEEESEVILRPLRRVAQAHEDLLVI